MADETMLMRGRIVDEDVQLAISLLEVMADRAMILRLSYVAA
jgi:hypothetical protein